MINKVTENQINKSIEVQKDYFKLQLLDMGYFKTPDGRQLYELTLGELESIYLAEKERI